jgi:hypothetical protein
VILQVRGDYRGAERACLNLMPLAERLLSLTCLASVRSLAGQAEKSYALLREALVPAKDAPSPARLWALTTLAETAHRNGYDRDAEDSFRAALDTAPRDAYLLAAYADFLLDHRRPEPVVALLARQVRIDGLLLRLALAEQLLGTADFASHRDELAARFAASRLRGDTSHQGDEARFTLHLMHDPARALALAEANWSVQREPRDARILLEAALAAHRSEAARPVLEFIERYGLQDQRLSALREQLGKIRL